MSTDLVAVSLVGGGPGELDLLTLDAEAALVAAREIVVDRSLAPMLAALAVDAVRVLVDDDKLAVDDLLAAVRRGPSVVRLYRGDPWFHPAGDGERAALTLAGVRSVSVAGVVEELAIAAAAGIPVQVRTHAVTTTFAVDPLDPLDLLDPRDPLDRSECSDATSAADSALRTEAPSFWVPNAATSGRSCTQNDDTETATETEVDTDTQAAAEFGVGVPADAGHTLVVRTTDLSRTATRLAARAQQDGIDGDRPAAALPTGPTADRAEPVRATLATLAARCPAGPGVVVVGVVAALDTRVSSSIATATR